MAKQVHYVPILKSKQGEFNCLGELSEACKNGCTPLVEIIPFKDDKYEKHLEDKIIKPFTKKWDATKNIFLDFRLFSNDEITTRISRGIRPATFVFDNLRTAGMIATPVTSIMAHKEYQEDVKRIIATDKRGFCLRLKDSDWMRPKLDDYINKILDYFDVTPKDVDLVIDLKDILSSQTDLLTFTSISLINNTIPHIKKWRSLTIVGTSFPMNLSGIEKNTEDNVLPRVEWRVWQKLWAMKDSLSRMPAFGDYSVLHSELPEIDFVPGMNRSAQIRYTIGDDWLVIKGRGVKQGGYTQPHVLSRLLIEKDEYSGSDFSWGDEYIFKCSRNEDGPGNPQVWRKAENSHHITFAVNQLSNFLLP